MGSFSDYTEAKILDHITGKTSFAKPTAYIALSTADPLDTGLGLAEPSGNNYSRVATTGADWNAASAGSVTNAAELAFGEASGAWGTITHFAICDNGSTGGGNVIASGQLTVQKAVVSGDTVKFAISALTITLD
jgi:hypothetical protein